jgi:hypothetical protein
VKISSNFEEEKNNLGHCEDNKNWKKPDVKNLMKLPLKDVFSISFPFLLPFVIKLGKSATTIGRAFILSVCVLFVGT